MNGGKQLKVQVGLVRKKSHRNALGIRQAPSLNYLNSTYDWTVKIFSVVPGRGGAWVGVASAFVMEMDTIREGALQEAREGGTVRPVLKVRARKL